MGQTFEPVLANTLQLCLLTMCGRHNALVYHRFCGFLLCAEVLKLFDLLCSNHIIMELKLSLARNRYISLAQGWGKYVYKTNLSVQYVEYFTIHLGPEVLLHSTIF
eukprot:c34445_g1_i1 orf=391-708(-)